jgi:hypothetical protein
MKLSHIVTIATLSASAICSIGAIGLVARQFTIERSAVLVMADTEITARLQGLSDAIEHFPTSQHQPLLSTYGFNDERALAQALSAQRRELDFVQQARTVELTTNDKRLTVLLAACGFNAIAAIVGAIAFHEVVASRRRRARASATAA